MNRRRTQEEKAQDKKEKIGQENEATQVRKQPKVQRVARVNKQKNEMGEMEVDENVGSDEGDDDDGED